MLGGHTGGGGGGQKGLGSSLLELLLLAVPFSYLQPHVGRDHDSFGEKETSKLCEDSASDAFIGVAQELRLVRPGIIPPHQRAALQFTSLYDCSFLLLRVRHGGHQLGVTTRLRHISYQQAGRPWP